MRKKADFPEDTKQVWRPVVKAGLWQQQHQQH